MMSQQELFRVPEGEIPDPDDQIGTAKAMEEFGLTYRQLQGMWNTGAIGHWIAGNRLVVLSRREIAALLAFRRTVRPAPPPGLSKHTGN